MNLTELERKKFEGRDWALYIPEEARVAEAIILVTLRRSGHSAEPSEHLWQGEMRPMFDISFVTAEFIADTFSRLKHKRILLQHENTRGWMMCMEGLPRGLVRKQTNNGYFKKQNGDNLATPVRKRV
jgi:hypothetical protein